MKKLEVPRVDDVIDHCFPVGSVAADQNFDGSVSASMSPRSRNVLPHVGQIQQGMPALGVEDDSRGCREPKPSC